MSYTADDRRFLYALLVKYFDRDELITLVVIGLGLNLVDLKHDTHSIFCRELVLERERRGKVPSLIQAILAQRADNPLPRAEHQALSSLLARLSNEEAHAPHGETTGAETKALQTKVEEERRAREAAEERAAREAETRLKAETRTQEEAAQRQRLAQELAQERKTREEAEARANQEAVQRQQSAQESAQERRARAIAEEQAAHAVAARLSAESQVREEVAYRQQLARELEELRQSQPVSTSPPVHRLSAWNPLDHLRLLWWLFMAPEKLVAHREIFGEGAEKGVGSWLTSTLSWLPLFIPTLALGLEWLPRTEDAWTASTYLWMSVGLLIAWWLTGALGTLESGRVGFVAVGVAFGVMFGMMGGALGMVGGWAGVVAGVVAGLITFGAGESIAVDGAGVVVVGVAGVVAFVVAVVVAGVVAFGLAFGLAVVVAFGLAFVVAFGVAFGVDKAVRQGHATPLPRTLFVLLVAAHGFLVWFSFLGGWRLFGAG